MENSSRVLFSSCSSLIGPAGGTKLHKQPPLRLVTVYVSTTSMFWYNGRRLGPPEDPSALSESKPPAGCGSGAMFVAWRPEEGLLQRWAGGWRRRGLVDAEEQLDSSSSSHLHPTEGKRVNMAADGLKLLAAVCLFWSQTDKLWYHLFVYCLQRRS